MYCKQKALSYATGFLLKMDDNIHKSEALERYDKRTLTIVKCKMYNLNKIVSKFDAKLQLGFLGLYHIDSSFKTLYFVVP